MAVTSYVQGHDDSTLQSHRSRSAEKHADYLLPHIKRASRILDVGCGPATVTCDFAKYVPEGSVIGIDYSNEVIDQARSEATQRDLHNVSFQAGSAHELPFPDETFDIVHCNAVLVHLPNALGALKEMRRVCRAGGIVAAREPDWSTCTVHPLNPDLERWKAAHIQLKHNHGAEPNAGRHLAEWAVGAGFAADQIRISSDVLQYFGKNEAKWWGELYAARMKTEFGKRAIETGVASADEIDRFAAAYLQWSKNDIGLWAMVHMRLLCRK